MKMAKSLTALLFFGCLATINGCVSIAPARPATGPLSAGLKIINESKYVAARLTTYGNGDECNMSDKRALVSDAANNDLLMPSKTYETRIPAGQIFSVNNHVSELGMTCQMIVSFLPVPGKDYILHVDARAGKCWLGVERIETAEPGRPPSTVVETSARLREHVAGILHGGAICAK